MSEQEKVINILKDALSISETSRELRPTDTLLGGIPELDSMTVVTILIKLENHYGFVIDDDEIDADVFDTVKSLIEFVEQKLSHCA